MWRGRLRPRDGEHEAARQSDGCIPDIDIWDHRYCDPFAGAGCLRHILNPRGERAFRSLVWEYNRPGGVSMNFKIIGPIADIETIAVGRAIRERARLRKLYGKGRWRKRKGMASVRLSDGTMCRAEIHWYEAHGVGIREYKIKSILSE